jgi:hypothetical protein
MANSSTIMTTTKYRNRPSAEGSGLWTAGEHARFLQALTVYPSGPWRLVAAFVGTRNVRQTMTHAQKHKQKIARHERGLRSKRLAANANESTGTSERQTKQSLPPPTPTLTKPTPTPTPFVPTPTVAPLDVPISQEDMLALLPLLFDDCAMPLAIRPPEIKTERLEDDLVLATPVVADCLDYLVKCFAY